MKKPVNLEFILYSKMVSSIDTMVNPYLTSNMVYKCHYFLFRNIYRKIDTNLYDKLYFKLDINLR
jgi:hypothetical protein